MERSRTAGLAARTSRICGITLVVALLLCASGQARAQASFQTGQVVGSVTATTGDLLDGIRIRAESISSQGSVETQTDMAGEYGFTLPAGDYLLEARFDNLVVGNQAVSVVPQSVATVNFTMAAGKVTFAVLENGTPSRWGSAVFTEAPPAGCEVADTCSWVSEGSCQCTLDDRDFYCSESQCNWHDQTSFQRQIDDNGLLDAVVPAGDWRVTVYSGQHDGQWGSGIVSEFDVAVAQGQQLLLEDVHYQTGLIFGVVSAGGQGVAWTQLEATFQGGHGYFDTQTNENGEYSLIVPVGDYEVGGGYQGLFETQTPVTVVAGGDHLLDLTVAGGWVEGQVLEDGEPASDSQVVLRELGPDACGLPEDCFWNDGQGSCHCELGGREYHCYLEGCYWMDNKEFWGQTDYDGNFSILVIAGDYAGTIYAAHAYDWPLQQWGQIAVDSFELVVEQDTLSNIGAFSYETGFVTGLVTSCGLTPSQGMRISVASDQGEGQAESWSDFGFYTLRLPVGDYSLDVNMDHALTLASTQFSVVAGSVLEFSPDLEMARILGFIMRDGGPANQAMVVARLPAPESCAVADSCYWSMPEENHCHCTVNGAEFYCNGEECSWQNGGQFTTNAGENGTFALELPPANYLVDMYSGEIPGQWGQILVGTVEATAGPCETAVIGASVITVEPGQVDQMDLGGGVYLTFTDVLVGGGINVTATSDNLGGGAPAGIQFVGPFYQFLTDALVVPPIEVCVPATGLGIPAGMAGQMKMYAWVNGQWVLLVTYLNGGSICGVVDDLGIVGLGVASNGKPLASAGHDQTVMADNTCSALVTLDGSASADPDSTAGTSDGIASYQWFNGEIMVGSGKLLELSLPIGIHQFTLVVTDTAGETSADMVKVKVHDGTPPTVVTAGPVTTWPPNHKYMTIEMTDCIVEMHDDCTPDDQLLVALSKGWSDEAEDGANDGGSLEDVKLDCVAMSASVRGERVSVGNGRAYTLQWLVGDLGGNVTVAQCKAVVPVGKKGASDVVDDAPTADLAFYLAQCAFDSDVDSIPDDTDNCPGTPNANQSDLDGDGSGDVCDPCPGMADDACLNDADGDGIPETQDNCPALFNPDQADTDSDALGDPCDVCPLDPNQQCSVTPPPGPGDGETCDDAMAALPGVTYSGNLDGAVNDVQSNCTGASLGDVVFAFDVPVGSPMGVKMILDPTGSKNVAYELRRGNCVGYSVQACFWDQGVSEVNLIPGRYFLVVEGPINEWSNDGHGDYVFKMALYDIWTGACLAEDLDGDGVSPCEWDCNEQDDSIYPGAIESCDGLDDNCDGLTDNIVGECLTGLPGICGTGALACGDGGTICVQVNQPEEERCADGLDNDCDGLTDEDGSVDPQQDCLETAAGETCDLAYDVGTGGQFTGLLGDAADDMESWCTGEPTGDLFLKVEVDGAQYPEGLFIIFDTSGSQNVYFNVMRDSCPDGQMYWPCIWGGDVFEMHVEPGTYYLVIEGPADPWNPEWEAFYSISLALRDVNTWECLTPDGDGDGVTLCDWDCNDADGSIFPGAGEVCDGVDNDCNWAIDDLYGDCATGLPGVCGLGRLSCGAGGEEVCDQTVFPKEEICADGRDNDCDADTDEPECIELPPGETCDVPIDVSLGGVFAGNLEGATDDVDQWCLPEPMGEHVYVVDPGAYDGPIDVIASVTGSGELMLSSMMGDCPYGEFWGCAGTGEPNHFGMWDMPLYLIVEAWVEPGMPAPDYELTVAIYVHETEECIPGDGDGDGFTVCDWDCNDADGSVFPGATEICDGIDNNCNWGIDDLEGPCTVEGQQGVCAQGWPQCDWETGDSICNQTQWPTEEYCLDGQDNDCDGLTDEDGMADPEQTCGEKPTGGPCCEEHPEPGCDDPGVMECVCTTEQLCCDMMWDIMCVDIAMNDCAACDS